MATQNEYWDFVFTIVRETADAYLVTDDGGNTKHWLPKSQVEIPRASLIEVGKTYEFSIPEWLAERKELM